MENIEEDLKDRVYRLRKAGGFTQESLAISAGVSTQTIKDIEAGRTSGGLKSLTKISQALGITFENLTGETEVEVGITKMPKTPMSLVAKRLTSIPDDMYDLFDDYEMDEHAWDLVKGLVEKMVPKKKPAAKNA